MGTTNWKSDLAFMCIIPALLVLAWCKRHGSDKATLWATKLNDWTLSFSD